MVTIEPIRNQYLTALKERQHIIDKLNEIIVGLNALDFDDLTTIHTKLTEIETEVNNVKSDLESQLEQIEQIESELTSYDNRITANASKNTDIENHLNSFESETEVNLNTKVNKSGDTMTGNLSIPTTSTGVRDKNAVNGERLQNDLDNYGAMIRNTGNQSKAGIMTFENRVNGTIMLSFRVASYGYTGWIKAVNMGNVSGAIQSKITVFTSSYRVPNQYAELFVSNNATPQLVAIICKGNNTTNASPSNYGVMVENDNVFLYVKKNSSDMAITVNIEYKTSYGAYTDPTITDVSEQVSDPTQLEGFIVATKLVDG